MTFFSFPFFFFFNFSASSTSSDSSFTTRAGVCFSFLVEGSEVGATMDLGAKELELGSG